jgi:hypothetical protein
MHYARLEGKGTLLQGGLGTTSRPYDVERITASMPPPEKHPENARAVRSGRSQENRRVSSASIIANWDRDVIPSLR